MKIFTFEKKNGSYSTLDYFLSIFKKNKNTKYNYVNNNNEQ